VLKKRQYRAHRDQSSSDEDTVRSQNHLFCYISP
jgi:hypothetical protein